ncbi:hypothetical protein C4578_03015 [Candidatus Microgenomates bacterium]|jgi:hypothetical protein|nr:MAG: hypothetical protein C4578_03015 [Candidatus Microgenomates bacterium]
MANKDSNRFKNSSVVRIESTRLSEEEFETMTSFPEYYDEETISGSMPNPESDDDTLKSEQEWGLYLDVDGEHPKELDIAGEVARAERARRRSRR